MAHTMARSGFVDTIRGKITLASFSSVAVLIVVGAVATFEFRELGKLIGSVSSGAEVLMRLSHLYDEREDLLRSFRKGYASAGDPNGAARARFEAIVEDYGRHSGAVAGMLDESGREALRLAGVSMGRARLGLAELDRQAPDEREVKLVEIEEALDDTVGQIALAKLESSRVMEQRLLTVQHDLARPERLFWLAAGLGGLIALGISVFLQRRVSRPLETLSVAVDELARGEPRPIPVIGQDELARLGQAFNRMATTITERNRSLRLVLDSVGDGLLTCDQAGVVQGEPSRSAQAWFGAVAEGARAWDYLLGADPVARTWFALGFEQLVEGILPFDVCASQMPQEIRSNERIYALGYRPVLVGDVLERVLIVVTDVTDQRTLAKKERDARDVYHLASIALREPDSFADFVADTNRRLGRIALGQAVMLELHTIKGNAGVMGCDHFASSVHAAESLAVEGSFAKGNAEELETHWRRLVNASEHAIGGATRTALVVPRKEYDLLCDLLARRRGEDALLVAKAWSMHRLEAVFARLSRTAEQYAVRAGKRVSVEVKANGLAVPRGRLDELWSSLVHLIRNTVAHGVEPEAVRMARGKPPQGLVSLEARASHHELAIVVADDGDGIDWAALGVAKADDAGKLDVLTNRGSTASEVSEVAGRGVGLAAVRKVLEELGGRMVVRSVKGVGTEFEATVPTSEVLGLFHAMPALEA